MLAVLHYRGGGRGGVGLGQKSSISVTPPVVSLPIFGRFKSLTYMHTTCFLFSVISPCSHGNGGCSHLCFIVPDCGYRCGCPNGTALREDGYSCQEGLSIFLQWIFILQKLKMPHFFFVNSV